jgi:hypothetical protein
LDARSFYLALVLDVHKTKNSDFNRANACSFIGAYALDSCGHAILISIKEPQPDLAWFSIDLLALAIALIWCLRKQSVASCVFVLLYELVGLAVNILDFDEISKVSEAAAWMHASLRAIGCGLAIYAIVNLRQRRPEQDDQVVVAKNSRDT